MTKCSNCGETEADGAIFEDSENGQCFRCNRPATGYGGSGANSAAFPLTSESIAKMKLPELKLVRPRPPQDVARYCPFASEGFCGQALGERGLAKTGTKAQLVDRLVEATSNAASSKPAPGPGGGGGQAKRPAASISGPADPADPADPASDSSAFSGDESDPDLLPDEASDDDGSDPEANSPGAVPSERQGNDRKRPRQGQGSPGLHVSADDQSEDQSED